MDRSVGAPTSTEAPPKAFEQIVKTSTRCSETARQLAVRSEKLVSLYIGEDVPQKDKCTEEQEVASVVLVHALKEVEIELAQSLSEISRSLEKLEQAW